MFALQAAPLEVDRLAELNAEYQKGAKRGSYGEFVKELQSKLQKTEDLKEAARLATLIRAYIHGQIIGFDGSKPFTEADRRAVLGAHATVTAFLTLSPLGTDRYREDTLRYVMHDVKGRYAQELTIVADAVQAALWAGGAGTREHVTKEVFLRWMTPAYQRGGIMDVSGALGDWRYENHEEVKDIVDHTIDIVFGKDFFQRSEHFAHSYLDISLGVEEEQREALCFKEGQCINVQGNSNQCGFYSIGKPSMRHQDRYYGPRKKFTDAFERACWDPQLFWMLVAFAKNKDWKSQQKDNWEALKKEACLNYERFVQKNSEVLKYEREQLETKIQALAVEFAIIKRHLPIANKEDVQICLDIKILNLKQMYDQRGETYDQELDEIFREAFDAIWEGRSPLEGKSNTAKLLRKVSKAAEGVVSAIKLYVQQKNPAEYARFIRETINPELTRDKAYADSIRKQNEYTPLAARLFLTKVVENEVLFMLIPFELKKQVVEAATFLADSILNAGEGQLEINPGTNVDVLDTAESSLDTLVAYVNDRAVNVLCTSAVMDARAPHMRLSESKKLGGYYLGKVVRYSGFGQMYTVNHGGSSGGHYQMYITANTPCEAVANVLRNPNRGSDSWDLLKSALWHSQNNVPHGNNEMLQNWTAAYNWR